MRLKRFALGISVLGLGHALQAAEPAYGPAINLVRTITLEECIQQALENNLSIKNERLNMERTRAQLFTAYGYYDPDIRFRAVESFNSSPGGFDPLIGQLPANETYVESFSAGLAGVAPWTGLRYDASGRLNRDSGLSADRNTGTTFDRGFTYQGNAAINLTQPLLRDFWIDQGRLTIKIDKNTIKARELQLILQIMTVARDVEKTYYDVMLGIQNVRVKEQAVDLAANLLAQNQKRVEVGAMPPLEARQAASQLDARKSDLVTEKQLLWGKQNQLKSLISGNYRSLKEVFFQPADNLVVVPERFDLQESWGVALADRPDLLIQRRVIAEREMVVDYQKNQLFPALDVVGSYGHNGVATTFGPALDNIARGDNPAYSYGVQLSVPLTNRRARGAYRVAKLDREQEKLIMQSLEEDTIKKVEDAVARAHGALISSGYSRTSREYAEEALLAEQKKFENGISTSFQVLSLQNDLTLARLREVQSQAEYNKALADLDFEKGYTLRRNKIVVESRGYAAEIQSKPATVTPPPAGSK